MKTSLVTSFVVAFAVLAGGSARAQAAQAERFLERRHEAVLRVLRRSADTPAARKQRNAKLDRMLADLLDYRELSRRALRSHWDDRSESERERFVELLEQLVQRSYKRNLERTISYRVRYTDSEETSDGVVVRTEARSKKNPRAPAVRIDYRMRRTGGQWRVYDVITDGVSMVRNYRNQFNQIIDDEGWSGLISRMEKKLRSEQG